MGGRGSVAKQSCTVCRACKLVADIDPGIILGSLYKEFNVQTLRFNFVDVCTPYSVYRIFF